MTDRKIETTLYNILDLIACAEGYGFADDVLMCALFKITGKVTDEEIKVFVKDNYLSAEDCQDIIARLKESRDKYGSVSQ